MAQRGTVANLLVQLRVEMGQLRTDVKNVEKEFNTGFNNIKSSASRLGREIGAALGLGFSVRALFQYTRSLVDLGGRLDDLSKQTGIAGSTLSGLKSTLEENGTSIEAFATGVFNAQKEIGQITKATDPAALAIKDLGLNLEDLRKSTPEQFFSKIVDALSKVESPTQRAALGTDLLKRQYRELAPAIEALAGKFEQLKKSGLNDEQIATLDRFGDAWTRFSNKLAVLAAGPLTAVIEGLETMFGLTARGTLLQSLIEVETEIGRIQNQLQQHQSQRESAWKFLAPTEEEDKALRERLAGLKEFRRDLDAISSASNRANAPKPPGREIARTPTGTPDRTAQNALESFTAGLRKQTDALQLQIAELQSSGSAYRGFALDVEFAAQKQKLLDDPKTRAIVPQIEAAFSKARPNILALGDSLDQLKQSYADIANELEETDKRDKARIRTVNDLIDAEERLRIEALEPLDRQIAEITKKWKDEEQNIVALAIAAGRSQEVINQLIATMAELRDKEITITIKTNPPDWTKGFDIIDQLPDDDSMRRRIEAAEELAKSFKRITGSIGESISETINGVMAGTQTLSEGVRNMFSNILLGINEQMLQEFIIKPMVDVVNAFMTGLAKGFAEAGDDQLKIIAERMGSDFAGFLKDTFGNIDWSSILGTAISWIGSLFGGAAGGVGGAAIGGLIRPEAAFAGLPKFATGGAVPIIAHGGEVVFSRSAVSALGENNLLTANRQKRWPKNLTDGETVAPTVVINGDIIPRAPWMTKDDVVKLTMTDAANRGPHLQMLEKRMMRR